MGESQSAAPCKRPYELGRRQEASDRRRDAVLTAAREQLERGGLGDVTMDSLAKAAGVTRQTIHNLFGTRSALLEALFDALAADAGMGRMREVFMAPDGDTALARMVEVFTQFWSGQRMILKKIRAIAALEPDFGAAVKARDARRQGIAARVVERLSARGPQMDEEERGRKIACLVALTSFEFFDAMAESCGDQEKAAAWLGGLVRKAVL
jgi:AcrR family transcriptional regulator